MVHGRPWGTGRLPAVLVLLYLALPWLTACSGADQVAITAWRLESAGVPDQGVSLPGFFEDALPPRDLHYTLTARVAVPSQWRGAQLVLVIPAFDGIITAEIDGRAVAKLGPHAPQVYRQPGPHRFAVPDAAADDGVLDVTLGVEHTASFTAAFGAAPRLLPADENDPLSDTIWVVNVLGSIAAVMALAQIGVSSFMVYLTDRSRRAYLWFGVQTLAATVYPLYVLGVPQLLFRSADVAVMEVGIVVAATGSVFFTTSYFGLPRPRPRLLGVVAAVLALLVAMSPFPHNLTWATTATVLTLGGMIVFQFAACRRLWRMPGERQSSVYLAVSWVALALAISNDAIWWLGLGDPLHGARLGPLGLATFAVGMSLLFSERHTTSLATLDAQKGELKARVDQLETNRTEIEQLNAELRHQLIEKSAQIFAALSAGGQPGATAQSIAPGDCIADRYRVVGRLGAGGMGEVFEVVRLADQRRFALKISREKSGTAVARLAREAQVALKVRHPNVVEVVDVDVAAAGYLYIVMELVSGAPLRPRSASGRVDIAWTIEVLGQIARGLAALHKEGVVHRDLKPANVLIAESSEGHLAVKISDFGISLPDSASGSGYDPTANHDVGGSSQLADDEVDPPTLLLGPARGRDSSVPALQPSSAPQWDSSPVTRTGFLLGTPAYIAPELAAGRSSISAAADMFSFGVLAYELLTSERPFAEPPVLAALHGRAIPVPASVCVAQPAVGQALSDLIDRCLLVDPGARPRADALAEVFVSGGLTSVGPSAVPS